MREWLAAGSQRDGSATRLVALLHFPSSSSPSLRPTGGQRISESFEYRSTVEQAKPLIPSTQIRANSTHRNSTKRKGTPTCTQIVRRAECLILRSMRCRNSGRPSDPTWSSWSWYDLYASLPASSTHVRSKKHPEGGLKTESLTRSMWVRFLSCQPVINRVAPPFLTKFTTVASSN